jgi:hypothetical protein
MGCWDDGCDDAACTHDRSVPCALHRSTGQVEPCLCSIAAGHRTANVLASASSPGARSIGPPRRGWRPRLGDERRPNTPFGRVGLLRPCAASPDVVRPTWPLLASVVIRGGLLYHSREPVPFGRLDPETGQYWPRLVCGSRSSLYSSSISQLGSFWSFLTATSSNIPIILARAQFCQVRGQIYCLPPCRSATGQLRRLCLIAIIVNRTRNTCTPMPTP